MVFHVASSCKNATVLALHCTEKDVLIALWCFTDASVMSFLIMASDLELFGDGCESLKSILECLCLEGIISGKIFAHACELLIRVTPWQQWWHNHPSGRIAFLIDIFRTQLRPSTVASHSATVVKLSKQMRSIYNFLKNMIFPSAKGTVYFIPNLSYS